jgi:hypothetical protein
MIKIFEMLCKICGMVIVLQRISSFLRSRIAGRRPEQPKVSAKEFQNIAIICGLHTQKDKINELGCEIFVAETGQKLTNFYSIDKWGKGHNSTIKKKWGNQRLHQKQNTNQVKLTLMIN